MEQLQISGIDDSLCSAVKSAILQDIRQRYVCLFMILIMLLVK
jgi:hypothetical protein